MAKEMVPDLVRKGKPLSRRGFRIGVIDCDDRRHIGHPQIEPVYLLDELALVNLDTEFGSHASEVSRRLELKGLPGLVR